MTSYTVKQPLPNLVLSNSIRLATVGLTKTLALELGSDGIRFNSILPATIDTDRVRELAQFRADKNKTTLAEEQAKDNQKSVFGRIGRPEEFANVAVFLLSPAAHASRDDDGQDGGSTRCLAHERLSFSAPRCC
jgi:3-oxoacyl-[acyl-carrier protein] reductase